MASTALILDTHALLWFLLDDPRLQPKPIDLLNDPKVAVHVSAVSAYEVANKFRIGKLPQAERIVRAFPALTQDFDYIPLSLKSEHALLAGRFNSDHKDPFDRMLAAQSIVENLPIMTIDQRIADLGAKVMW